MKVNILKVFLFYSISFLFLNSCLAAGGSDAGIENSKAGMAEILDYSKPESWSILPEKVTKAVDVFYVYPTIFADPVRPVLDISVPSLRKSADWIANVQTMLLGKNFNIYAPHYRQCEFSRCLTGLEKNPMDFTDMQSGFADIRKAFLYYIENYNQGRPFILLGHSQGSLALLSLIQTEFSEKSPVFKRMVAAYLIGWKIKKNDLEAYPHLRTASGEFDTGVIVSWNTETAGTEDQLFAGGFCINPLNWRTDAVQADKSRNLGAVFFDENGNIKSEQPAFCGAVINTNRGTLVVDPENPELYFNKVFSKGVLHCDDIYFFYRNIEKNAIARSNAFLSEKK